MRSATASVHHFEEFLRVYDERFQRTFGFLRSTVVDTVHRFLDCGILEHGFARLHCDQCGRDRVVAFSCRQRCLCPSCHQKRELEWSLWVASEVLEEVPHRQVVFTIPKRLRVFFRYDRRLLGELAGCAWRALRLYLDAYFEGAEVRPGAIGFISTSGELLRFHPHLHVLLADGGWLPDGTFRHLPYFDTAAVERLFRAEVLRLLADRGKITEEVVANLLAWRHSGFSVHGAVRVEGRQDAARLGRYMIRCPIVLERLEWDEEAGEVVCSARPGRTSSPYGTKARWDVLEFIAHVVDHLPEPGQQLVRYWGWYSNAARGKRRRADDEDGETAGTSTALEAPPTRRRRLAWAKLIRLVYEVDPLLCEFCGCRLRLMAFLTDHREARRFLAGIGESAQTPEPLAHSPPGELELVYEPA